jgi:hypothetical protein
MYSLFTHDCLAKHTSNSIIKFADDTTVVGLITNNDETAYREVKALGVWCQVNNLSLNTNKTKEMIVDFMKQQREHPLSTAMGPQWRRWKASSSLAYTSLTNQNGPHTQTVW